MLYTVNEKRRIMKAYIGLILAVLIAFGLGLVGCKETTGPDDGNGDHGLGWALDIANPIRNAEFPGAKLFCIVCNDINDNGELEAPGDIWHLFYAELPSPGDKYLDIVVSYDGSTYELWDTDTSVPPMILPEYRDAKTWVTAARNGLDAPYSGWNVFALIVTPNEDPDYPDTINIVIIEFEPEDLSGQAIAFVDADTNEFLGAITP
jgi:hypothetical protein